jgi:hypothetical protein
MMSKPRYIFFDTEYGTDPFRPRCHTAIDPKTGQEVSAWADTHPPYPFPKGDNVVAVSFYGTGDQHYCEKLWGWRPPHFIDLHVEYALATNNGVKRPLALLDALDHYHIPRIASAEKKAFQSMFQRDDLTLEERRQGLGYNAIDTRVLIPLWQRIAAESSFSLPHALHRGRVMKAVDLAERVGIPVNADAIERVHQHRLAIINDIVERFDPTHEIFDTEGHITIKSIEKWLENRGYLDTWPRTKTGQISLNDDDFEAQILLHPRDKRLQLLWDAYRIRLHLPERKPHKDFQIWRDGRAHFLLSPYRSKTSRFLPRTGQFPLARPVWERRLYIAPPPGCAFSYLDWCAQELAILAWLSRDPQLIEAYRSMDPHLYFAKMAGLLPKSATKYTHPAEREIAKKVNFGVIYGQTAYGLALVLGVNTGYAQRLLDWHRNVFHVAHRWLDDMTVKAAFDGEITSLYGWRMTTTPETRPNTLRNWQIQTTGAEILRIALCLATERGASIAATLHDAMLVVCSEDEIVRHLAITSEAMLEAGRIVLEGFEIRVDTPPKIIRYPHHYYDGRDEELFCRVSRTIGFDPASGGQECGNPLHL